jgi:predicted PolB exonuclease-like 3'-5' exonuclease
MSVLFLDIETIPVQDPVAIDRIADGIRPPGNMKKAETIAAWERDQKKAAIAEAVEKTSFNGGYGQVICIGYAVDDGEAQVIHVPDMDDSAEAEKGLLHEFTALLHMLDDDPVFCGHNVRDFDLRFLYQRTVVRHGQALKYHLPVNTRPGDPRVFDTMTQWAGWGNRISLAELSAILGTDGKTHGFTGADVWPTFQTPGGIEKIAAYCKQDVEAVRQIYRRMA